MNNLVYYIILLFLSIWEVWMVYYLIEEILFEKRSEEMKGKIIKWGNIIILGSLLMINRTLAFFSRTMFLLATFITIICIVQVFKEKICTIFIFVIFFNTSLVLLDFVFAYSCIELIGVEFAKIVYMENNSIWAIGIFTLARGLTAILLWMLKKESSEEMRIIITTYKNMFFVESIFLYILMLRCQVILVEMALGERKIQGIDKAIFLAVILTIVILGGFLYIQYVIKRRETDLLRLHSQMLEERCREMQNTRQIAHDMKNHIVVLKKFDEEGRGEELHKYIEALYHELTIYETQVWTGIEILDYLLTQKVKMTEQKKISLQIDAQRLESVPFSDLEIISVFGNLLDNAIEACENMKSGERWIHLLVKRKNQLFFLKVSNSIEQETDKRSQRNVVRSRREGLHGYGLKNVQQIVERHKGDIESEVMEGKYSVVISVYSKN